jgi:hypothetical protein
VSPWVDATGEWERHLPEMPDIHKVESTMNKFAGVFGFYSYSYFNKIYNVLIQKGTSRVQTFGFISFFEKMTFEVVDLPFWASPGI